MITLKHLRIFCEVAKTKSMSKAAENLFISQPSVTTKLQEIEKYYNVTLFQRYSKTLGISEEGLIFWKYAKKILEEVDQLDEVFSHNKYEITTRIGTTLTISSTVMPSILSAIKKEHPHMNFKVIVDNTQNIEKKLMENQLDIALVEGDINSEYIESIPIIPDMMVLVCSNQHPLAQKDTKIITNEELAHQSFIFREKGSGSRAMIEQYLISNKIPHHIAWESPSWDSIKQAVMANQGISLMSVRLIEQELQNLTLRTVRLKEHAWNRFFSLCYHKNKVWNQHLEIFKLETEKHSYCPIIELLRNKHL